MESEEKKQEELRDKFNLQILPASVQLEDGTWKELFNSEQYNEVIDYLFAIGFIDGMLKAEQNKAIDKCVEKCNFYISRNGEMNDYDRAWNDALTMIVGELNQLKEK